MGWASWSSFASSIDSDVVKEQTDALAYSGMAAAGCQYGDCTGGTNQKWTVHSDGTITNDRSGLCLDAEEAATANGTKLVLWTCNGQTNQRCALN
ncbi:RICIN domain-containing protein [Streptomyces canus]|uniref:RICIN domain-containing protein n=1 Tax=Streptomyces canus TaxID=58343 RepID=UPI0035936693